MSTHHKPRRPRASPLWQLIHHTWDEFIARYETDHRRAMGPLRPETIIHVQDFLRCGDLAAGFTRYHCPDCGHQHLLAFTCKSRHFCPACHQRRTLQLGTWIATTVCHPVPHRQYVFTVPKILRSIFRKRRHLLHHLFQTTIDTLRDTFRTRLTPPPRPHRCRRRRPHLWRLPPLPPPHPHPRSRRPLRYRRQIPHHACRLPRPHDRTLPPPPPPSSPGRQTHQPTQSHRTPRLETQRLPHRQWRRSPRRPTRHRRPPPPGRIFTARPLHPLISPIRHSKFSIRNSTAAAIEHIPPKGQQTIRYYGLYSNKSRGLTKSTTEIIPAPCEQPAKPQESNFIIHNSSFKLPSARTMRPLWRDLILRVWGTDPLKCPCCQGAMRRLETISRPEEIQFFLRLLGLWEALISLPPPPEPPFDVETFEPIHPPWQAIRGWIPDDEEAPAPDTLELWDQSTHQAWKAPEVDLGDGRIIVLEYPE